MCPGSESRPLGLAGVPVKCNSQRHGPWSLVGIISQLSPACQEKPGLFCILGAIALDKPASGWKDGMPRTLKGIEGGCAVGASG